MAFHSSKVFDLLVAVVLLAASSLAHYLPVPQLGSGGSHETSITSLPDSQSSSSRKDNLLLLLEQPNKTDNHTSIFNQSSLLGNAYNKSSKKNIYNKKKKVIKKKAIKKSKKTTTKSYSNPKVIKKKSAKPSYKPNVVKKKIIRNGKKKVPSYGFKRPVPTGYEQKRSSTSVMNQIDSCWRNDPNWAQNRMHLADCAIGFGYDAMGGKGGSIYVVTDTSDDPINPKPGTLRYGVVQLRPLWIIFAHDMSITLKNELIMTNYKTIDGRGAHITIAYGPCITIQFVEHIIIHGLNIHNCVPGKAGMVMSSTEHVGQREGSDGDAISIFGGSHIWIDHNYLAHCFDGLIDAIHASTLITISNNLFTDHDKTILLGHSDSFPIDKIMKVTLIYNHFGPGLIQRMPRCRFGHFHVVNNRYTQWGMYAIGASADPTIISQGNYFMAPNDKRFKQVTKFEGARKTSSSEWRSIDDVFLNGAYFGEDGTSSYTPYYPSAQESLDIAPGSNVPVLTADAGPLTCNTYSRC